MRVLATTCLLAVVVTAAGQCNDAAFSACMQPQGNECESQHLYTGEALCGCHAQVGRCAQQYNCLDRCVNTMAAWGCGADWCNMVNVTKPTKVTAEYLFTQRISDDDFAKLSNLFSPAVNRATVYTRWIDTSAPRPTLPPGTTPQMLDLMCRMSQYKYDCEQSFGYCRWTGTTCKAVGAATVSVPKSPPSPSDDIRVTVCAQVGQIDKCSQYPMFCVLSNNKCIPDPSGVPLPKSVVCPAADKEPECEGMLGLCLWNDAKATCEANNGAPPGMQDVRPVICSELGACLEKSQFCTVSDGKCVADPKGIPVPAAMVCVHFEVNQCIHFSFCSWTGDRCTTSSLQRDGAAVLSVGTTHKAVGLAVAGAGRASLRRAAEVLSSGRWQLLVGIEFTGIVNTPLVEAVRQQMNQIVSADKLKKYEVSVYKPAFVEVAGEGEATKRMEGSSGGGIKTGTAVGIAIGVLAVVVLLGVVAFMFIKRRKRVEEDTPPQLETDGVNMKEDSMGSEKGETQV